MYQDMMDSIGCVAAQDEDLAAAILLVALAVDPLDIERHEPAVADREHAAVDHLKVIRPAVGRVEDHAVGHADIVRARRAEAAFDSAMHLIALHLIAYIEISLH